MLLFYQNCGTYDISLQEFKDAAVNIPEFKLEAPTELHKIDRYIFLVDMSLSMVSGPCSQDVDGDLIFSKNQNRKAVNGWDPNKRLSHLSDTDYQQSTAYDCYVRPQYGPDDYPLAYQDANFSDSPIIQNSTIRGSDYEAHRLSLVTQWVAQLRNNLSPTRRERAQILIAPYTSTRAMKHLTSQIHFELKWADLNDGFIDDLLADLKKIHEQVRTVAEDQDDFHRWENRPMGASSPSEVLSSIYDIILKNMDELAQKGLLQRAVYYITLLSDGMLTPTRKQIDLAVSTHHECASCMDSGNTCPYKPCGKIREGLEKILGPADIDAKTLLALRMGKIQALNALFGSGQIVNHLVQINKDYYNKVYGKFESLFDILSEGFEKHHYAYNLWESEGTKLPFPLAIKDNEHKNFALDQTIILNPYIRTSTNGLIQYDSDADGLLDSDEEAMGTDPLNPRSNGICLDSLATHSAHEEKCRNLTQVLDCNPYFDPDRDSLNECEENLIGTSPLDFDTDNDSIPDYFEWTYQLNPLLNEKDLDSNGDGVTNLKAFLAGLSPYHGFDNLEEGTYVRFEINEILHKDKSKPSESRFSINIQNIPLSSGVKYGSIPRQQSCLLYHTRQLGASHEENCTQNPIKEDQLFFQLNSRPGFNKALALLRVRNKNIKNDIAWKIMRIDLQEGAHKDKIFINSLVNNFKDFNVLDRIDE